MYIPNLDPYSFTGTAVILGYLLTNDFTTSEQAALGAWFNVVGDILASNSSWSAVLEERSTPPSDDDNDDTEQHRKSPPDIKIAPESFGSEVSDHDYIIWVRFFGLQYAEQACFASRKTVQ